MRGFLLILLLSFFPALQCYEESRHFFVTRRDTKEAICIQVPNAWWAYTTFPTFDLDKLQIPRDVGIKYWDWLADWKLQNDTNVRLTSGGKVLIAGNQPFRFVAQKHGMAYVTILASNLTLWMATENESRGAGMLYDVDHLNETTKLKDTTLKYCDQNPEVEGANCTIVAYENGTNFLNDGNHWTVFSIEIYRSSVEMFEMSYGGNYKPVVQCTWNNTNISNPFTTDSFKVFAKSHQRNAAIDNFGSDPDLANNKEMKRNYTKRSSGKLCVFVRWNEKRFVDFFSYIFNYNKYPNELLKVKNLVSRRVQQLPTKTIYTEHFTIFLWNHLDAGEYEFTLRFDKRQPWKIDLCRDDVSMMRRTWVSMPKAITKCQFRVGLDTEFSAGPSSPPDPTIKPIWSLEAWAYVCGRLGVGSNDPEVQIKFCDWKGCNFSKCPHLQHEPAYIFDF